MKNQKKLLCLVLVLALIATLFVACADATNETATPTTEASEVTPEGDRQLPQDLPENAGNVANAENYGSNSVTALSSYSVLEAAPNDSNMSAVVAINDVNEVCLTNGELQIYYWIEFYNFMNSYGSYASMFGLDTNKPFDQQQSMQEGSTWEQYFLESAMLHYSENYALAQAAYEAGYTMSEEDAANLADMDDPNGKFAAEATQYNYASVEDYLQANFGKGVGIEDYKDYLRTYYAAYHYYNEQKTQLEASFTDEDIEAHYDENAATFEEQGLKKVNNIKVRHILISVEGEKDENGEYSAEAWATAKQTADDLYAQWLENPTEENFAAMAKEHSSDPGSKEAGGLYDDVYPGQMVETFNDWCFDASRAIGNHGIVETPYGYHIMYFVGQSENRKWFTSALEDMLAVRMNELLDEMIEKYPVKIDYTLVRIYDMISNSTATE